MCLSAGVRLHEENTSAGENETHPFRQGTVESEMGIRGMSKYVVVVVEKVDIFRRRLKTCSTAFEVDAA